ncbi:DUF6879 family protein [Streptomyces sp. NBC_01754]|uniref:DUF6879 family protein n=1 Tax=Streptomyces sp. NBC_01754 TaxID=2975930 RepID=UPI003FA3753A
MPTFAELLAETRCSAVHLETRDVYAVAEEDEDFAAFRAGKGYDLADKSSWWTPFHQLVRTGVDRGISVRRVRVVSEPVTEYIRYEHSITPQNLTAGEDVRWLPRSQASDLLIPGNDLWLFDDRAVKFGLFTGDGGLVGHEMTYDPDVIRSIRASVEGIWERGIPHQEFKV